MNIINQYQSLLEVGRKKLNREIENDVEDHLFNNKVLLEQIINLNNYVYTYYSTNSQNNTQSIEFIVLSDALDPILERLNYLNFWYIAKKYEGETIINVGTNNNKKYIEEIEIKQNQIHRFHNSWKIIDSYDDTFVIQRTAKFFYLESEHLNYLKEEYDNNNFINYFDEIDNVNRPKFNDDFYKKLAVITIENPNIDSKKSNQYNYMYATLYNIIEPIMNANTLNEK
jgi:hypothetical protein